jgi:sirohydrochlorin ferrochelatase
LAAKARDKKMRNLLLVDNGSSRAESTLNLRRLAAALGERIGEEVHPVSLLHASKVSPAELEGRPADTLDPFLRRRVAAGLRELVVLPLFFGRSGALTGFIPETVRGIQGELGPCDLRMADVLCPLPGGEPRLVQILLEHIRRTVDAQNLAPSRVVLVDHGSPLREVTQVRRLLAAGLRERLGSGTTLGEAVMERRAGKEYDFNGELLEDVLRHLAEEDRQSPVILSMLFLSAGRHAGAGGDIDQICGRVAADFPGFRAFPTPLVGSHPLLIDILEQRYRQVADAA